MSGGVFQTDRDIFNHPIWKRTVDFRMFFLIYGKAVFSKEGYRVTDDLVLQRGQWLRSTRKLQEDLEFIENRQIKKYSTSVINNCIKRLVELHMICTKTHELGTVFTVVNYEQYQGFGAPRNDNLEHNLEHSENTVRTVSEQYQNNNNKDNKENKVKKEKKEIIYTAEFSEFWNVYPRTIRKTESFKTWVKVLKSDAEDGITPELLIQCAKNYAKTCENKGTEDEFILHPTTFLNKKRYKDYKLSLIGGGNSGKYGSVHEGPSEASRRAASQGSERFIGTPGTETVSPEELARFQEELRNFQ